MKQEGMNVSDATLTSQVCRVLLRERCRYEDDENISSLFESGVVKCLCLQKQFGFVSL